MKPKNPNIFVETWMQVLDNLGHGERKPDLKAEKQLAFLISLGALIYLTTPSVLN